MDVEEEVQEAVDTLFADWKQKGSLFVSGLAACEQFEEVSLLLDEWVTLEEEQDWDWNPKLADQLSTRLSNERVTQLATGDEPTEEEMALWEAELQSREPFLELISVYRLQSSEGGIAWLTLTLDGNHQGAELIDGAGPYFAMETMARFLSKRVSGWDTWASTSPEGDNAAEFEALLEDYVSAPSL